MCRPAALVCWALRAQIVVSCTVGAGQGPTSEHLCPAPVRFCLFASAYDRSVSTDARFFLFLVFFVVVP